MKIDDVDIKKICSSIKGRVSFDEAKQYEGYSYYADYIELFVIASKEEVGEGDIKNYFYNGNILADSSSRTEYNDSNESFVKDCLKEIGRRLDVFGDKYPFDFCDNSKNSLVLKKELSSDNILYIQLLISSKLTFFSGVQAVLTTDFEKISEYALKEFLSPKASIIALGKNTTIKGTAQEKIVHVANLLNGVCKNANNFITGNQEYGVDIVAHVPFDDNSSNRLVYYCQCGCGSDINKKCAEPMQWLNLIELENMNGQIVTFFPYNYIVGRGRVLFSAKFVGNPLIFERKRIMDYCKGEKCIDLEGFKFAQSFVSV